MDPGYQELGAVPLAELARAKGWTDAQANNARRLLDGDMGQHLGYKSFEETMVGDEGGEPLVGEAWVYYLYEDRIDEVVDLI